MTWMTQWQWNFTNVYFDYNGFIKNGFFRFWSLRWISKPKNAGPFWMSTHTVSIHELFLECRREVMILFNNSSSPCRLNQGWTCHQSWIFVECIQHQAKSKTFHKSSQFLSLLRVFEHFFHEKKRIFCPLNSAQIFVGLKWEAWADEGSRAVMSLKRQLCF